MNDNKIVWVLTDDRAGNNSQVIGLANALNMPYIIKEIRYNIFVNLPNFIRGSSLIGINKQSREQIIAPFPDIVISAGRREAPVALYIKKYSPQTRIINLMNPDYGHKKFDYIILPEHDKQILGRKNIITTLGAMHKLSPEILQKEAAIWQEKFISYPKPLVALIIGGDSKNGNFTLAHGKELSQISNEFVKKLGGSLLITTSRRTSKEVRELIKNSINVPHYFYDFDSKEPNPYIAYLALADIIIVTGDSVSMCSEACFAARPVFIYSPFDITGDKHRRFQQSLYQNRHAAPLNNNIESLIEKVTSGEFKQLNEAERIGQFLK